MMEAIGYYVHERSPPELNQNKIIIFGIFHGMKFYNTISYIMDLQQDSGLAYFPRNAGTTPAIVNNRQLIGKRGASISISP